jgi:hypothetical protein
MYHGPNQNLPVDLPYNLEEKFTILLVLYSSGLKMRQSEWTHQ